MAQRPNFYEKLEEVGAVGEVGQYEVSRSVGGYHPQFAAEIVSQSRREPPLEISLKSKSNQLLLGVCLNFSGDLLISRQKDISSHPLCPRFRRRGNFV